MSNGLLSRVEAIKNPACGGVGLLGACAQWYSEQADGSLKVGCDELDVVLLHHGVIDLPTSCSLKLHEGVTSLNHCVSAIARNVFSNADLSTEVEKGDLVVFVVIEVGDDVLSAA